MSTKEVGRIRYKRKSLELEMKLFSPKASINEDLCQINSIFYHNERRSPWAFSDFTRSG